MIALTSNPKGPSLLTMAVFTLATVANVVGQAAANQSQNRQPNILLLLSDDQRPDTIAALGNSHIHTPMLDELVSRGTTFLRAVAPNPICTPSRAEIMTGCTGLMNGVFDFGRQIRPNVPLWARTMAEAGYVCWYVGKWHNDGRPTDRGYQQTQGLFGGGGGRWAIPSVDWAGRPVTGYRGWVFQTDTGEKLPEQGVGLTPNISERFADAAIHFIQRRPDRPFFLHVNFTAPHDPLYLPRGFETLYDPDELPLPPNFLPEHPFDHGNFDGRDERLFRWPRTAKETKGELAAYYAVISHLDAQVGRILQALDQTGQRENTLVIFTSDHGVAVGSHGLRGKQNMYEHTIGVPLILSGPGIPAGKRCQTQCYLRDLFPTACDLAGIPVPEAVEGLSLRPALNGDTAPLYPFMIGYFRDKQRMIRTERWKLIEYPQIDRFQLFDLQADPFEIMDLSADSKHVTVMTELRANLREWQQEHHDPLNQRR